MVRTAASTPVPIPYGKWITFLNIGVYEIWLNLVGQAAVGAAGEETVRIPAGGAFRMPPTTEDRTLNAIASSGDSALAVYATDEPFDVPYLAVVEGDTWDPANNCIQHATVGDIGYDADRADRPVMDMGSDSILRAHLSQQLDAGGQFGGGNTVTIVTPTAGKSVRVHAAYMRVEGVAGLNAQNHVFLTFATSNFDFCQCPVSVLAAVGQTYEGNAPRVSELGAINEVLHAEVTAGGIGATALVDIEVYYTEE